MAANESSLVFLQYLTTVFDSIADGILLITIEKDGTFRLMLANQPFFDFSGYNHECVGQDIAHIVESEPYTMLARHLRKVIRTKQPHDFLRWIEVPAGLRALQIRLVPILGITGDCARIACVVHDATEREQLREEVERLRATVRGIRNSA